jgi:hypothetical protein
MNFSRVEWDTQVIDGKYVKVPDKPEFNWVWSPQGVVDMHRPEMWGVVIFQQDSALAPNLPADFHWDLRETAHAIYYAQKEFFKKNNRWATSLKELKVDVPKDQEASLKKTLMGWNATIAPSAQPPEGAVIPEAHIRDDAYFWFTSRRAKLSGDSTSHSE